MSLLKQPLQNNVKQRKLNNCFLTKSEKEVAGFPGVGLKQITLEEYRKTIEIGDIFHGNVYFDWGAQNGCGQLSFSVDPNTQRIFIMNECMSRETVRQILYAFVDKIVDEGDMDCNS